jgi:hypothetical protein
VARGDQVQQQVRRRRPARGYDDGGVVDNDTAHQRHISKPLHETVLKLPVDRRALPVEETGLGQHIGTGAQRPRQCALGALTPQGGQQWPADMIAHVHAGQREQPGMASSP